MKARTGDWLTFVSVARITRLRRRRGRIGVVISRDASLGGSARISKEDRDVNFTDEERKFLTATRSITRDEEGREVLVGLTERESLRYMAYVRRGRSHFNGERELHQLLHEKHDRARLEAIGIEQTVDMPNPPWARST